MDISCSEEIETEELQSKRLKTCEVNKDFISGLPDPVLLHILSYLPLKDAVRTVLFPRFGKLWLSMPVIDLDNCAYHQYHEFYDADICEYEEFMEIVSQVWNHHSNITLDKLRLKFPFLLEYSKNETARDDSDDEDYEKKLANEKNAAFQVEKLISYAISRKVKVLDLNFKGCDPLPSVNQFYVLPDVLASYQLADLRLTVCEIRSCENLNLQALRVLFLKEVSLCDQVMTKVLLECPSLEDLSLVDCYGLRKLKCKNPNLKKLMITPSYEERTRLYIKCPHVVSLKIYGWIERAMLLDGSSLVDASIHFSYMFKCRKKTYAEFLGLLLTFRDCKNLSLCRWSILVMSIWILKNWPHLPLFKWKNLLLRLELSKWHLLGLSFLLRSSRCVETLDMYIFGRFDQYFQFDYAKWIWEHDFDEENYLESQEATFTCLQTVAIYGHVGEPNLIQVVKFLLKNAPKLQKMEISTKKTLEPYTIKEEDRLTKEQMLELSQKLLKLPRASTQAMIYLS